MIMFAVNAIQQIQCWDEDLLDDDLMTDTKPTDENGCAELTFADRNPTSDLCAGWDCWGFNSASDPDVYCLISKPGFHTTHTFTIKNLNQNNVADFGTQWIFKHRAPTTTNGCGPASLWPVISTVITFITGFEDPCRNHDFCYDNCKEKKEDCDTEFHGLMISKCMDAFHKSSCTSVAYAMYAIVAYAQGGTDAYVQARINYKCDSVDECNRLATYTTNSHRYGMMASPLNWTQAQAAALALPQCCGKDAHLVTIGDMNENNFIDSSFKIIDGAWIGLSDAADEGNFSWVDGTPLNFKDWNTGEPNGISGGLDENCGEYSDNKKAWNDQLCSAIRPNYMFEYDCDPIITYTTNCDALAVHLSEIHPGSTYRIHESNYLKKTTMTPDRLEGKNKPYCNKKRIKVNNKLTKNVTKGDMKVDGDNVRNIDTDIDTNRTGGY
jgi:Lectin C-type domain